jgi:hypothetical protein
MPFEAPVSVVPGDRLKARISCANNGSVWRWRLAESGESGNERGEEAGIPRFQHSNFFGSPCLGDYRLNIRG